MKMKHNKKRNTAFLYESLIKELTKAIVRKQEDRKKKIVEIIKKYFNNNSILREELDVYNSIITTLSLNKEYSLRLMYETKKDWCLQFSKKAFSKDLRFMKIFNSIDRYLRTETK